MALCEIGLNRLSKSLHVDTMKLTEEKIQQAAGYLGNNPE